mgnify:CR=1 FL=1
MRTRKRVSVFAAVMSALLMLAGCGSANHEASSGVAEPAPATPGDNRQTAAPADSRQPEGKKGGKFVFWDKSEYVKEYNDIMKQRAEQFGKDNNIEVEYVIVPPNDLKTKLMAAIEAKNPPDLVVTDDFLAKQFVAMDQLVDVGDIVDGIDFKDGAKNIAKTVQGYFMVPQSIHASGGYLRKDVWDRHHLQPPTTWQELYEQAKIVNDPQNGFYAVGFPLGASGGGDAEGMVRDIVSGFGGSFVDENNHIVVNSRETLEAITFLAKFYKENLTPPSSVTWDDLGNNNAYLAGTVGLIFNAGSLYNALKNDKPDLEKNTLLISKLGGPKGRFILGGGNVFAVFKNGSNTDAAKRFVTEFFDKTFYDDLVTTIGGMWIPVLNGLDETEFWKDPNNKTAGWLEQSKHVVGAGNYPGPEDDLGAKVKSLQLGTKAVQRIVVGNMDPQQSLDILEQEMKEIYGAP